MSRALYRLWPDRRVLLRLWSLHVARAVLEGVLLALLVPVLRTLLRPEPDFGAAAPWLVVGAVGGVAYIVVAVAARPVSFRASTELSAQLRRNLMAHVTVLPLGWFTTERKGQLGRTITAATANVTRLAVLFVPTVIAGLVVPAVVTVAALIVDWQIGLILAAAGLLAAITHRWVVRIARESEIVLEQAATEIAARSVELAQAQPVLRATGHAAAGTVQLQAAVDEHERRYRAGMRRALGPVLLFQATLAAAILAVVLIGTARLLGGGLAVADAVALFVLTARFVEIIGAVDALAPIGNTAARIDAILQVPPLPIADQPQRAIDHADIELVDVTFSYGNEPVLSHVSLRCPPGTTTALVGPSGSGKTTVTRLIARFFDPDSGSVRIDGTDVRNLDPAALMDDIAIVFQDVYLLDDTIEANVRLGRPEATAAELAAVARAARLTEVVERLPDGWQTRVGEAGAQLSGGERQRVSIARALLKPARVVLIDEASSALDPENEVAVSEAIAALAADPTRTVVVIAHRPATLATADRVVAIDAGRVVETGTPDVLLAAGGPFARLYHQYEQTRTWHLTGRAGGAPVRTAPHQDPSHPNGDR